MATDYTTSPNMNLQVPIVGVASGPAWATYVDNSLGIIDGHTHQAGSGVPITPGAININTDLLFNGNNAINLRTTRYIVQTSAIASTTPDQACIYSVGGELYWNDTAGHQVPITNAGNVNAGAGSITNLPFSGAAAFNSSTGAYVWESTAAPTAAYMDNAGIIMRYNASTPSPTGNYVLLNVPTLSGQVSHTLPGAQSSANGAFWTESTSGTIGYTYVDNSTLLISGNTLEVGTIPQSNLAPRPVSTYPSSPGEIGVSNSSGLFSTSSTSYVQVTNLSLPIVCSGRPIIIALQPDGNTTNDQGMVVGSGGSNAANQIALYRGSTLIASWGTDKTDGTGGSYLLLDSPGAGSFTYSFYAKSSGSGSTAVYFAKMLVYEL